MYVSRGIGFVSRPPRVQHLEIFFVPRYRISRYIFYSYLRIRQIVRCENNASPQNIKGQLKIYLQIRKYLGIKKYLAIKINE